MHLDELFKWFKEADLKIKCSKCEFFKSKVHYLGYLVGADSIQPLLVKVTAIEALEPPQNLEELQHFLGAYQILQEIYPILCQHNYLPQCHAEKGCI